MRHSMKSPINVITKGGKLQVSFNESFSDIHLIGPAKKVFDGIC
jgi:diaminopimelate epimerase